MNRTKVAMVLMNIMIALCGVSYAATAQWPESVSMLSLIAVPEKYHNKYIRVCGYLIVEPNDEVALYFRKNDYDFMMMKNALWLALDRKQMIDFKNYTKRYVCVQGYFNEDEQGFMEMCSGTIERIDRMQLWGRPGVE